MVKTLFDISASEDAIDWQHCRLIMEVGQHIFSYAVINGNKRVLRMRVHELEVANNHDLMDALEEIVVGDDVLKEKMKESVVIYNFPESHLVPGVLLRNKGLRFLCRDVHLRVENSGTLFTGACRFSLE